MLIAASLGNMLCNLYDSLLSLVTTLLTGWVFYIIFLIRVSMLMQVSIIHSCNFGNNVNNAERLFTLHRLGQHYLFAVKFKVFMHVLTYIFIYFTLSLPQIIYLTSPPPSSPTYDLSTVRSR